MNFKDFQGQLVCWIEMLLSYDFYIEYRLGKFYNNVDSLSRMLCKQCKSDYRLGCFVLKQDLDNVFGFIGDVILSEMQDFDRNLGMVKKWLVNKKCFEYNVILGEFMIVKLLWF